MGGRPRAELGGVQGLPLAAGAEDEEDGVGANAVGGAGAAAAEGMGVDMRREEALEAFPELIGDAPVVRDGRRVHGQPSCIIVKHLQELYPAKGYSDRL
jgi:hypothetical protein